MFKTQSELRSIAVSPPSIRAVMHPELQETVPHLCYDAEVQYKRKDNQVRLIMCSSLDDVVSWLSCNDFISFRYALLST